MIKTGSQTEQKSSTKKKRSKQPNLDNLPQTGRYKRPALYGYFKYFQPANYSMSCFNTRRKKMTQHKSYCLGYSLVLCQTHLSLAWPTLCACLPFKAKPFKQKKVPFIDTLALWMLSMWHLYFFPYWIGIQFRSMNPNDNFRHILCL